MDLSNDLLSQFAKLTKNDENTKKEDVVYGTVVVHNDIKYVKLDGSEVLTPVTSTTEIEDQNRVMVMVKNHTAVVTGNISSPSASTDSVKQVSDRVAEFHTIIADKADIDELDAQTARINSLVAENAVIKGQITASEAEISEIKADNVTINEKLTANEADIKKLQTDKIDAAVVEADYATIKSLEVTDAKIVNLESTFGNFKVLTTEQLTANKASIDDLETRKLNASDAEIKYANINFSNIGKAAIEYFYSTSGLIKNVVVGDQTITGELVGVTIKGDLIEGNTIVADKLVIKGTDGLYYKLNTDGITTEAEQTDYNSLNGSVIRANSITAEKIAVSDLVAFDATIAGFKIEDTAIYSGVKNSATNTTRGIYLGKDGQVAFGDGNNYIKYYKDETGAYKLAVSADSMTFSTGTSVKDAIDAVENKVDSLKSIDTSVVTYQVGTSATIAPTGEWSLGVPTVPIGQYLWTRTIITYTDQTTTTLYSVSSMGEKGEKGDTGPQGPTGLQGVQGPQGVKGNDGQNATYITVSGTNFDAVLGIDKNYSYISINGIKYDFNPGRGHTLAVINPSNGVVESIRTYDTYYSQDSLDSPLNNVESGKIICLFTADASALTPTSRNILIECGSSMTDTWEPSRMTHVFIGMKGLSRGNAYEWFGGGPSATNAITAYYTPSGIVLNGRVGETGATGATGATGNGVKSTSVTYQAWPNGTSTPTGTWLSSPPATTASAPYLWTRTIITYTNGTTSTSYSVGSTPEGIVVGGRNLYLNSKNFFGGSYSGDISSTTFKGFGNDESVPSKQFALYSINALNGYNGGFYFVYNNTISDLNRLKKDETYTISFWIKSSIECRLVYDNIAESQTAISQYPSNWIVKTEWQKFEKTFKYTIHNNFTNCFYVNKICDLYISSPKLELGNKATDWTPAPEDVDDAITTVDSRITQEKDSIISMVSSTYQRKDAMGNYSTTEQMNSAIAQTANSITNTVSSTYTTKTEFNNLQVGGRNLIINSKINETSNNYGFGYRHGIALENDTTYTFTVNGRSNPSGNTEGKHLRCYLYDDNWSIFSFNFGISETVDTTRSYTFTTPSNIAGVLFHVGFYWFPEGGDRTGNATVNWCKLELGNKATDWTPAPEDVDDAITTVDSKFSNYATTASLSLYLQKSDTGQLKSMIEAIADTINITAKGGLNLSGNRFTLSSTYTNISANGVITTNSTASTGDKMQGTIKGGEFLIKNLTNNSSVFMQGHTIVVNNNNNKEVLNLYKRTYNDTVGHGAIRLSNNSGTTTISLFGDTGMIKCNALIPKVYSWGLNSRVTTQSTEWDYFKYTYTFKGPGLLIANAAVWTDETDDYGTTVCAMYIDDACVSSNMHRYGESSNSVELDAGCSFVWYFSDSNTHTLRLKAGSSKVGTKTLTRSIQGLFGLTAV